MYPTHSAFMKELNKARQNIEHVHTKITLQNDELKSKLNTYTPFISENSNLVAFDYYGNRFKAEIRKSVEKMGYRLSEANVLYRKLARSDNLKDYDKEGRYLTAAFNYDNYFKAINPIVNDYYKKFFEGAHFLDRNGFADEINLHHLYETLKNNKYDASYLQNRLHFLKNKVSDVNASNA
jgi:hypothetical protein